MRLFQYRLLIVVMLICISAQEVCAADYPSEQEYLQDFPIVLSASRLNQPLSEAPNAVTVIDRGMIKESGFRTTADIFRLVPGMYVDYQSGGEPLVGYRGATDAYPRRMQVLIDGRSVALPPYNIVDWNDLPLNVDDIERIEVVRGPAATSYGSNSILGVINIITRDASSLQGATVSVTKGNDGISDFAAHIGKSMEKFDYRLTFGMHSDNGLNFPADYHSIFDGYNDDNATHYSSLRSNYHPNGTDSFDIQLGYSTGVRATGNPQQTLYPPRNVETESGFQQISWLHLLNNNDDIQLHYYHISRNSTDERVSLPISGVSYSLSENSKAQRQELELQHTVHTNSVNRFVWGAGIRYDEVDAPFLFLAPQSLYEKRLFANDEWRILPVLLMNAGAMLEDDGMGNTRFSPRIALNYHITPEDTLRAGISVAYRNPAFGEESSNRRFILGTNLYQSWLSSGGLSPERALSREIGYIGKYKNKLSIDVRAYNDQVSNVIWVDATTVNIPGLTSINSRVWDFNNEFSVHYTGLEGTIKYYSGANSLTFNYAHQLVSANLLTSSSFLVAYTQGDTFSKTAPVNSGSLLLTRQMNEGLSLSAGYYEQGTVQVLDGIAPQPLMRRLDIRIAKHFGTSDDKKIGGGEITLVVQNALNDSIVGYSGYTFDRRAFVTATVNF